MNKRIKDISLRRVSPCSGFFDFKPSRSIAFAGGCLSVDRGGLPVEAVSGELHRSHLVDKRLGLSLDKFGKIKLNTEGE